MSLEIIFPTTAGEGSAETGEAPTEEEVKQKVEKGKVTYQAIKPMATAILSTLKTEMLVRLPGELVEASNFERRDDGSLRLAFDGPRLLSKLEELAQTDAAEWYEFAVKLGERKRFDEDDLLWKLNEIVDQTDENFFDR